VLNCLTNPRGSSWNPGSYRYVLARHVVSRGSCLSAVTVVASKDLCQDGNFLVCLTLTRLPTHNGVASHDNFAVGWWMVLPVYLSALRRFDELVDKLATYFRSC
jgi:hypothetical protein